MTYESPFKSFANRPYQSLQYTGTLEGVLNQLGSMNERDIISNPEILALHPPRIICAFIDYKIENEKELLLRDAIEVALGIYQNPRNSQKLIKELREKIKHSEISDILGRLLEQKEDSVSWKATDYHLSKMSAMILNNLQQEILFITLAHGGIAAGMDVYLEFCSQSKRTNSKFYVARLSTQKMKDLKPRLTKTEIEYLNTYTEGRQVVIFDEDSFSGETMIIAEKYFEKILRLEKVNTLVNLRNDVTVV